MWRELTVDEKEKLKAHFKFEKKFITIFFRIWQGMGAFLLCLLIYSVITNFSIEDLVFQIIGVFAIIGFFIVFPQWLINNQLNRGIKSIDDNTIRAYESVVTERCTYGKGGGSCGVTAEVNINGKLENVFFKVTSEVYELLFEGDKVLIIAIDIRSKDHMRAYDIELHGIEAYEE